MAKTSVGDCEGAGVGTAGFDIGSGGSYEGAGVGDGRETAVVVFGGIVDWFLGWGELVFASNDDDDDDDDDDALVLASDDADDELVLVVVKFVCSLASRSSLLVPVAWVLLLVLSLD
jgi:hypothetical protein